MNSRHVRWITAAVAAGLLAGVALAQTQQQKPAGPATGSKAPQTGKQAADQTRDQAQDPTTGRRRGRDIEETGQGKSIRVRGKTGTVSDADRDAWRQMLVAEAKYRKRLAQVRRYRELAEKAGDKKRIVKADYLENKIKTAHEKQMTLAREQLGDEKFNLVKARMQQGRQRRGATGKGGPTAKQGQERPGAAEGRGRTGTTATGQGQGRGKGQGQGNQDPQKRSRGGGERDTGQKKSEDS